MPRLASHIQEWTMAAPPLLTPLAVTVITRHCPILVHCSAGLIRFVMPCGASLVRVTRHRRSPIMVASLPNMHELLTVLTVVYMTFSTLIEIRLS